MNIKKFRRQYEHCLGDITTETFLDVYWQKEPLLVRNAFNNIKSPISAEELAGLACEDHVNARLVLAEDGDKPWQVEFGPFDESRFGTLPESNWSLLVSDVEKHLPETKALLEPFRFIPDWRIDDLMISYAPQGGSVGAHTDAYDVFLLQLSGQRLWQISKDFSNEILPDTDLRILKNFNVEQEWLLNPGDMLYLPPNVAHYGVAQGNNEGNNNSGNNAEEHCMTASIGFRAPSLETISSEYIHYLHSNDQTHKNNRFTDKIKKVQDHHAEITDSTVSEFSGFLKQGLRLEPDQVKRWLGHYFSDNKTFEDFVDSTSDTELNFDEVINLSSKSSLIQSPYSRFLFSKNEQSAVLFVNRIDYAVSTNFAQVICENAEIDTERLKKDMTEQDKHVFTLLFNSGAIIIDEPSI